MLISLSHFCPTAAALLIAPSPFQIVTAPASLSLDGHLEGFDARDTLPPLLSPQMLTTPDGYAAWERRAVGVLARGDLTAAQALDMIAAVTREVQAWRPGGLGLSDIVERAFDSAPVRDSREDLEADERRSRLALASVPEGLSAPAPVQGFRSAWQDASRWWSQADGSVRAYLASRLFGNWVAYYGHGLHTVVEYLRICLAVLKMEAARRHVHTSAAATASSALSAVSPWQTNVIETLRNADLLLVHLSDTRALVQRLP
jgi:hypothetical protein